MSQGGNSNVSTSFDIICDVINRNESHQDRRMKLLQEVEKFMNPNGTSPQVFPISGLDYKSRDEFQPMFNHLKTFLYDMHGYN